MIGKLTYFDHSYRANIRMIIGDYFSIFSLFNGTNQEVQLTCHHQNIDILVDALIESEKKRCTLSYGEVYLIDCLILYHSLSLLFSLFMLLPFIILIIIIKYLDC